MTLWEYEASQVLRDQDQDAHVLLALFRERQAVVSCGNDE